MVFFKKNGFLNLPKMGRIMFSIRWCNLTGAIFMYARKFYSEENKIGKMGYQVVTFVKKHNFSRL
jgi:hypothetical protein